MKILLVVTLIISSHPLLAQVPEGPEQLDQPTEAVVPTIPADAQEPPPEEEAPPAEVQEPPIVEGPQEEARVYPSTPARDANDNLMSMSTSPEDIYVPRASHWLTTFGFEGIQYEVPMDFDGAHKNFSTTNRQLYGGRLGLGREFHLFSGFKTTSKVDGFYMGTLFESVEEAEGEEYLQTKKTGQIYGAEIGQSFGYEFDMATKNPFMDEMTYLTVEPFVMAGLGAARAYNRQVYSRDTTTFEEYKVRVNDDLTIASIGAGVNFTARTGFFLYLKATQYRANVSKRTEEGSSLPEGGSRTTLDRTSKSITLDPITVYALGGGYKW